MSASPFPPSVVIVGGKPLTLVKGPLSRYRYGLLGDTPVNDYAARLRIAWACDTAQTYPNPEALAAALTDAEEPALFDAVDALLAPVAEQKKSSSPTGPSPALTSESQPSSGCPSTIMPSTP